MAKNATIGALRVSLSLDTAQFSQGIENAQGAVARLASQLKAPLIAAGTAVAAAMVAVGAAVKKGIDRAAEIQDVAEATGAAVEQLSSLAHAAKIEGVELDALGSALGRLSKNLAAVGRGEGQDAARAMEALGISARNADGSLKNSDQVLSEVAERFSKMEDGAGKAALAMALFGKTGATLIPLLNNGAAGLREYRAEAEALGLVIDGKTAKAADTFNENLTRLGQVLVGLGTQIAVELLPYLVDFTNKLVEMVKQGEFARQVVGFIRIAIAELNKIMIAASAVWAETVRWMQAFNEAGVALKNLDLSGVKTAFATAAADVTKIWSDANEQMEAITNGWGSNIGAKGDRLDIPQSQGKAAAPDFAPKPEKIKAIKDAMTELGEEGQRVWEQTRTPMEAFGTEVARLGILMKAGVIDSETYSRAIANLKDEFGMAGVTLKDIGSTLGQTFSSAFDGLIDGSKKATDVLKDLMNNLTSLALNSVFKNLSNANGGASGGFLGSLFDSLANFAGGGSFKVGGAGGIDSQLVAFRASPDERVSITKPGQERGGVGSLNFKVVNNGPPIEMTANRGRGLDAREIELIVNPLIDRRGADPYSGLSGSLAARGARNPVKRR